MTADLLRQAADKLDELADAAYPKVRGLCDDWFEVGAPALNHLRSNEQELVAAMHPGLAKALAVWLRFEAGYEERHIHDHALTVARAVLGEVS